MSMAVWESFSLPEWMLRNGSMMTRSTPDMAWETMSISRRMAASPACVSSL